MNQRVAPAPIETNGIAVVPGDDGTYTVWVSTQIPFDVRDDLAETLGVERDRVRAIAPDVGGAFGAKLQVYAEYHAVAAVAARLGRPVRWQETRSESMVSLTHGRAQVQRVELGAKRDGTLVGLRADILADMGAYPIGAFMPGTTQEMLSGVYRIPRIASSGRSVVTNATPVAPYRGAGRPEATALVERAMDMLAAELGMDPVALRRKNLIGPDEFPYTTVTGVTYDTGDYAKPSGRGAPTGRLRRAANRAGRSGEPVVTRCASGSACRCTSRSPRSAAGSSRRSRSAPTDARPWPSGPRRPGTVTRPRSRSSPPRRSGSRSRTSRSCTRTPGSSRAGRAPGGRARCRSAAPRSTSRPRRSSRRVARSRPRSWRWTPPTWSASKAGSRSWGHPTGVSAGRQVVAASDGDAIHAEGRFRQRGSTFPFGAHVAVVEVDTVTGEVRLLRHVAVDDCGRILNPALVRGQQHGGLGQGIAQALFEEVRYDESGNPVTSTLATYQMPSAADLPSFETSNTETPTDLNPLGVKGIGESATIGSTPAVQNAVVDALSHLGVRHIDLPLTPERVWRAINESAVID